MKNIVVFDEYNEVDLKPSNLLHRYIELTKDDVTHLLLKGQALKDCVCPACQSPEAAPQFLKFALSYKECSRCRSLYVAPRPDDRLLNRFYLEAKSRIFWRDELSKSTNSKRKEKIIKPRMQWIVESTQEYLPAAEHIVDINTNQYGYTEELAGASLFRQKTLVNPFLDLSKIRLNPSIKIIDVPWWNVSLEENVDVISLFEITDRTSDLEALFSKVKSMLRKDGLCFITAILVSGFDLQTLWEKAENLYPPDRLNVLSIEGWQALFARHGFECLELSTPGILDVEIVAKALKEDPALKLPKFVEYILQHRSEDIRKAFQEFLQSSLLSSYGRILIRKK